MDIKIGDKDVGFVFQGDELIYPNYIKDGLVLHYDFSGMGNNDATRGVARDLSGNGNDGELENFAFDEGSGYVDGGLEFDGVDDYVRGFSVQQGAEFTWELVIKPNDVTESYLFQATNSMFYISIGDGNVRISIRVRSQDSSERQRVINSPSDKIYNGNKFTYTFSSIDGVYEAYINGLNVLSQQYDEEAVDVNIISLGRWASNYPYFNGQVNSFRLYNRALTPEEIAHNYKINKHRFNITE